MHAKTLEHRADDYTPNVRLRLETGRYILAEDYLRALRGRDVLIHEVDAAMERARRIASARPPDPGVGDRYADGPDRWI